jgi:hypothetical protein
MRTAARGAGAAFKTAIDLEPQISDNCTNLGNTYLQVGWFEESVGLFGKAIAIEADLNYSNLGTGIF